jgi:hypothetical protein
LKLSPFLLPLPLRLAKEWDHYLPEAYSAWNRLGRAEIFERRVKLELHNWIQLLLAY